MTTTHRSARKRAPKLPAHERRRRIVEAATGLFAQTGYVSTATKDVASAAGVHEPTVYRYFPSKQDLYLEVIRASAQMVREAWVEIAQRNEDALTGLAELGGYYAQQLATRPEPLQLYFRAFSESHDPRVREIVRSEYLELMSIVETLFAKAQEQGTVRTDTDARTLTWSFMAFGALLDVTRLIGLEDQLTAEHLASMTRLLLIRKGNDNGDLRP